MAQLARALTAAIALAAIGCGNASPDAAPRAAQPEPLAPAPAGEAERLESKPGFIATLTPEQLYDVTAPYTSASVAIAIKLGDAVIKGQTLARLDDRQLQQELEAANAQLSTARAAVGQAIVDRRTADINLKREKTAEAEGVGSHADVIARQQELAKANAAIGVARATVDERGTKIKQLRAHLSEMTLTSPIAGSVAMVYPQDGARVEEGRPVVRVISGGMFVKFAIPADKASTVKLGDRVDLRLDRRSDVIGARVDQISPELDAVAQMVIARAALVDPPSDLQPGTVGRILPRAK